MRSAVLQIGLVLGGIAAAVLLLAAIEGALRVLDVGTERGLFTAEVNENGVRVLRLFWNPQLHIPQPVQPQRSFLARKPRNGFRIFVVGESSAEGSPYGPAFAFPSWLARRLEAEVPEVHWEVVNAALAGAQSGSMLTMVRDIARHEPDLLVVYLGHNEIGARMKRSERIPLDVRRTELQAMLARMRLYRVLARALPGPARHLDFRDAERPGESLAIVRIGSPRDYASDADRAWIADLYRLRIEEMVRLMRDAGARTALLTLAQNFADWTPVVSVHRPGMRPEEKAAWRMAVRRGDALAPQDCHGALDAWRQALAIDDGYALLQFKVADCERELGHSDDARARFRLASDLDRFSQGAPTSFNAILRDVAEREGAILVDVDAVLARASTERLVGDDLFMDALHPNLRAHQLIAAAVADALRQANIPVAAARWRSHAYVDPDPQSIMAAKPELRVGELIARGMACHAAGRTGCALNRLVAAKDATNDAALRLTIERGLRTAPAAADTAPEHR